MQHDFIKLYDYNGQNYDLQWWLYQMNGIITKVAWLSKNAVIHCFEILISKQSKKLVMLLPRTHMLHAPIYTYAATADKCTQTQMLQRLLRHMHTYLKHKFHLFVIYIVAQGHTSRLQLDYSCSTRRIAPKGWHSASLVISEAGHNFYLTLMDDFLELHNAWELPARQLKMHEEMCVSLLF